MNHTEIINYLIDKYNYQSYLEIGVTNGYNFDNIICPYKDSCDIVDQDELIGTKYDITYLMTSDEMFANMPINHKYDIIFIDGLHDEEYVDRDIINSLKHLNPGGIICVHDTITRKADYQNSYESLKIGAEWNGNVWKSITKLQDQNIEFYTIRNNDYGLTIIKYKENPHALVVPNYKTKVRYEYVFNDTNDFNTCITEQGKYVLHIISVDEFLNKF